MPSVHRVLGFGAVLGLALHAQAQIANGKNTGCPNAAYPTHDNTARIGRPSRSSWRVS